MFKKLFKKEEIISQEKVWDISEPITTLINLATLHPERFSCKVKWLDSWTECCTIKYKPKDIMLTFTIHNTGFGSAFNCKANTLTQDEMKFIYGIIQPLGLVRNERYKTLTKKRSRDRITKLLSE